MNTMVGVIFEECLLKIRSMNDKRDVKKAMQPSSKPTGSRTPAVNTQCPPNLELKDYNF